MGNGGNGNVEDEMETIFERYLTPVFDIPIELPPITGGGDAQQAGDPGEIIRDALYALGDYLQQLVERVDDVDRRLASLEAAVQKLSRARRP